MNIERIIPCLLIRSGGLYKTVKFKSPTYLGDPVNAVKIFSDKEADEVMLFDIEASEKKKEPDWELLHNIAAQAFMPICYGGGVSSLAQMERLYSLGIEKVALNTHAHFDNSLVKRAARQFGSQSVAVCLDFRRPFLSTKRAVYIRRGRQRVTTPLLELAIRFEALGAGELVLNSIDRDGTMSGFDHDLLKEVTEALSIPVIALGGASSLNEMRQAIHESGAAAAAAGSLFSFRWPERAVLINYPKNRLGNSYVHAS
jgi:cyclase